MAFNIVVTHGYSDSNKGDLAITQATIDGLKNNFPEASITLLSTFREADPAFWFHNRKMKNNNIKIIEGILPTPYIGEESSLILNVIASLRLLKDIVQLRLSLTSNFLGKIFGGKQYLAFMAMKNADLIVVKGGQFIYNDKEDLRGNLFLWRTLQPIKVAYKLKKEIIILGQSIGGFASVKSEKIAMTYLSLTNQVVVREQLSYNLLKKYKLKNVLLKPDMAFNIDKKEISFDNSIDSIEEEILGITVVNWSFPESKNAELTKNVYIENLIYTIQKAYNELKLVPVFIPQVTVKHHGKSDLDLINVITDKLESKGIAYSVINKDYSASELVSIYSKCKMLIGTRLHSCILAAVAGTPVIAIRYQGFKTQGVMTMLGLGDLVHDINHLNGDDLYNDILKVNKNHIDFKTSIENKVALLRNDIDLMIKGIKSKRSKTY